MMRGVSGGEVLEFLEELLIIAGGCHGEEVRRVSWIGGAIYIDP